MNIGYIDVGGFEHFTKMMVSLRFFAGPGGCRAVREADRNKTVVFSSEFDLMVLKSDQTTKEVHDKESNDQVNVSIEKDTIPKKVFEILSKLLNRS